jgi:hypothetical protein
MKFILLFTSIFLVSSYNILLYPGSQVSLEKYQGINNSIKKKLNNTITFKRFIPFSKYKNDTIIIGHSFGGYFGLIDAQMNNDTVKGVILLNSHFNSRGKMPYPRIDMKTISQPVLTILGRQDERLPFKKAIDDLFYSDNNYLINKHFIVNENFTHFSGLNDTDTELLSEQMCYFIENIDNYTYNSSEYSWYNKPLNVADDSLVSIEMSLLTSCSEALPPIWFIEEVAEKVPPYIPFIVEVAD